MHVLLTRDDHRYGWLQADGQAELGELGLAVVGALRNGENFGWRHIPDDYARGLVVRNRLQAVTLRASDARQIARFRASRHRRARGELI